MIPKKNKLYTYKDYLTFTDDERIEIIEGEIFNMSPAPARIHQFNLIFQLYVIKIN